MTAVAVDTKDELITAGQEEDRKLKRHLGFWHLTAIGFSGVIGSGWLLGAMYAAQAAGSASIITWLVGGLALLLIALVMVELGASRPESGGLVRWPFYSNGRLVATLIGWGIWVAYATNPPSESAAMLQYASHYINGIYDNSSGSLTGLGTLVAIVLMALFVLLNWFSVQLFARINVLLTVFKFVIPALTAILLLASGFDSSHFSGPGGFAPYGYSAPLSAIATAGHHLRLHRLPGADRPVAARRRTRSGTFRGPSSPRSCCRWWCIWRCSSPSCRERRRARSRTVGPG